MNLLTKLLAIAGILALTSCSGPPPPKVTPVDPVAVDPKPIIKIFPSNGSRTDYCNISGDRLFVNFTNSGNETSPADILVTVTFPADDPNPPTVETVLMPALPPNSVGGPNFPVPDRCFTSDCPFTIKWSNQEVKGKCIG